VTLTRARALAVVLALGGVLIGATVTGAQPSGCAGGTLTVTVTAAGHEHSCRKTLPDGSSVAHGYHIVWGKNGVKLVEGDYLEGQRHGRWITRDADGRIIERQEFDRGTPARLGSVKEPVWKGYTIVRPDPPACPSGHEIAAAASQQGFEQWCERREPDGARIEHGRYLAWQSHGWLREEGEYRNGRRHGRWTTWGATNKTAEREYLDGELDGRLSNWGSYNHQLTLQEEYRQGMKHGHASWFIGSGAKEWDGEFKDGKRDGLWTRWFRNGRTEKDEEWADDKPHGATTIWDEEGRKRAEGRHVRGQRDGWWTFWDASRRRSDVLYRYGEEVNVTPGRLAGCPGGTEAVEYSSKSGRVEFCSKALPDGRWLFHGPYVGAHPNGIKGTQGQFTDGKERGQWTTWDPNGQRTSNGDYWNGLRQGPWVTWYDNGGVASEGEYRDDREEGRWIAYWPNGAKMSEGEYRAGKKHGHWIQWSPIANLKASEGDYIDGKQDGVWTTYGEQGRVAYTTRYRAGRTEGHRIVRYESGRVHEEGDERNGKRDGPWTFWFENGTRQRQATYRNGDLHGRSVSWDATGRVLADEYYRHNMKMTLLAPVAPAAMAFTCPAGTYVRGDAPPGGYARWCETPGLSGAVREGPYLAWYPSGAKKEEGAYHDGKKHGRWTVWTSDGAKESEGEYREGREHGRWTTWERGQRSEGEYRDGLRQGVWTTWGNNGAKSAEGPYVDGKKHGVWTRWLWNGSKQEEATYVADKKNGPFVTYNGAVKVTEGNFRDERPEGHWITRHPDGSKAGEADLRDGRPTGAFTTWHANGRKSGEGRFGDRGPEGDFTLWDAQGRRRMLVRFADGQPVGTSVWDERGNEITDPEKLRDQPPILDAGQNSLLMMLMFLGAERR
jgi:uncharacterized protein